MPLGREAEVRTIVEAVLSEPPGSVLVIGDRRTGITSLVKAVLVDGVVEQRFQERRYYVQAGGVKTEGDLLAALAGTIDDVIAMPLQAGVIEHLAKAPAFLVLEDVQIDQAVDAVALDELATALGRITTLSLLVTASSVPKSFSLRWTTIVRLRPMELDSARSMFLAVAGEQLAADPHLDDILRASNNVPIVVELLARQAHGERTLQLLWDRWRAIGEGDVERAHLDGPNRVLDRTLALVLGTSTTITVEAKRLLAALAILPDGIAVADLSVLPSISEATASALSEVGLVQLMGSRIRLHDSLVGPTSARLPIAAGDLSLLVEHYVRLAEECAPKVGDIGGNEAAESLTAELSNVETAILLGLSGRESLRAVHAAFQFGNFMRFSGVGDERVLERACEIAQALGEWEGEANCIYRLGDLAFVRFQHERAEELYKAARGLYRQAKDSAGESRCVMSLGNIESRRQRWDAARQLYDEAYVLSEGAGDLLCQATCLERLGDVEIATTAYDIALVHVSDALARFRTLNHRRGQANCLLSLGQIALYQGRPGDGRGQFEEALLLHHSIGDPLGIANSMLLLCDVEAGSSPDIARARLEETLSAYRRIGNLRGEADCKLRIGTMVAPADVETATRLLREASDLYRLTDDLLGEAKCMDKLGELALLRGDRERALELYRRVLSLYIQLDDALAIGKTHQKLSTFAPTLEERREHVEAASATWQTIGRLDLVEDLEKISEARSDAPTDLAKEAAVKRAEAQSPEVQRLRKHLGCEPPWEIGRVLAHFDTGKKDQSIDRFDVWPIGVASHWPCPVCERQLLMIGHAPERVFRCATCETETTIHVRIPFVDCPLHGLQETSVPWADQPAKWSHVRTLSHNEDTLGT